MIEGVFADTDFRKWKSAVDETLMQIYSISIEDSGIDDEYLKTHFGMPQTPLDFVKWFGDKYDLTEWRF